jgi:WASH complex subunit 7
VLATEEVSSQTGVRDLSWFLQVKPLRLETKCIHIKTRVEMYLNAAFYNHAAVALHNWKVGCPLTV